MSSKPSLGGVYLGFPHTFIQMISDSDLTAQVLAVNNAIMQTGNSDKKLQGAVGESKVRGFLRVCLCLKEGTAAAHEG